MPSVPVVAVLTLPLQSVIVTLAFASGAPASSVTWPEIDASFGGGGSVGQSAGCFAGSGSSHVGFRCVR